MPGTFNPEMLALAREARALSQREVVERVTKPLSQAQYSKIESGLIRPSASLVDELARALRYRASFFYNNVATRSTPVSYHRKRQKLGARELQAIHARAEVLRISIAKLLSSAEIQTQLPAPPAIDPDECDGRVDAIARALRQHWMLPRGPVRDVTKLIEDAGIIVVPFDFGSPLIDGFSQHATADMPAVIFINSTKPKDRLRFSLAHELGHIIMHRLPRPDMEVQANQFAGEFLVPWGEAASKFRNLSMSKFMELKLYWNVSMQCLIYQAWQMGALSDRGFRYYQQQMSSRGFRVKEPIDLINVREEPTILRDLVRGHLRELSYSADEFGELLGLTEEDVTAHFHMAEQDRPRLRLVASN